jgi:hypothetical protein
VSEASVFPAPRCPRAGGGLREPPACSSAPSSGHRRVSPRQNRWRLRSRRYCWPRSSSGYAVASVTRPFERHRQPPIHRPNASDDGALVGPCSERETARPTHCVLAHSDCRSEYASSFLRISRSTPAESRFDEAKRPQLTNDGASRPPVVPALHRVTTALRGAFSAARSPVVDQPLRNRSVSDALTSVTSMEIKKVVGGDSMLPRETDVVVSRTKRRPVVLYSSGAGRVRQGV